MLQVKNMMGEAGMEYRRLKSHGIDRLAPYGCEPSAKVHFSVKDLAIRGCKYVCAS